MYDDIAPKYCMNSSDCTLPHTDCNEVYNACECSFNYQYNDDYTRCVRCKQAGNRCGSRIQCCGDSLECIEGFCKICRSADGTNLCRENNFILTASQIALVTALIMGIVALAMLLYRVCVRPNYPPRYPRNNSLTEDVTRDNVSRSSLSSIQIRILSRLRDRPPKYETQHNYDMRRENDNNNNGNGSSSTSSSRGGNSNDEAPAAAPPPPPPPPQEQTSVLETATSTVQPSSSSSTSRIITNDDTGQEIPRTNNINIIGPPPSYDNSRSYSELEFPPNYNDSITTPVTPTFQHSTRAFINAGFVNDNTTRSGSRDTTSIDNEIKTTDINKTLHI